MSEIKLSVVVTVYSDTFSIVETVETLLKHDRGYLHEIILVVSPRATQQTFSVSRRMAMQHPRVKIQVQENNPGIGWAYREGMEAAEGNFVCLMSADLETEPAAVERMVKRIEETGCDAVVANRWMPGGGLTGYHPLKLVFNWLFQQILKVLFWTGVGDLTFGFKILSREIAQEIVWLGSRHEICVETTLKPIRDGYHVEQVPSVWVARREGQSRNTILGTFRYLWMALKVRLALA